MRGGWYHKMQVDTFVRYDEHFNCRFASNINLKNGAQSKGINPHDTDPCVAESTKLSRTWYMIESCLRRVTENGETLSGHIQSLVGFATFKCLDWSLA